MRPIGRIVAAAAVGTLALGMAACSTSTDATGGSSGSSTKTESSGASKVDTSGEMQDWEKAAVKGDGTQTIYLVSKGFQHRFWQAVKEGAEQAGDELGYKVSFVGPQDETKVTEQTDQLKSALDSGPAAIGFAALDSAAAADLLNEIHDKGIPVVAFDSGVDSSIPVTTVQTNNTKAAEEAAQHMIELLKGKSGTVGTNEAAASGIVQGVAESGKDVTVVGFDSGKTQIDAIKAGSEAGAVTQSPVKIGYYTVKAAVAAINGAELPDVIDSGFAWYDKSNIDSDEIKANLYE